MSAIFGWVGSPNPARLKAMADELAHRAAGPPQTFITDDITLALLADPSGGEIKPTVSGCRAIAGNTQNGAAPIEGLRGMFVLAEWDATKKLLTLVRDGTGRRTLYHATHEADFLFASEPKAIHRLAGFARRIRPASLAQYLAFSFVPGRNTMLEGLHELPAGHLLNFSLPGKTQSEQCWFRPEASAPFSDEIDGAAVFRERLQQSIRNIAPASNLPSAAFLSGGLDSSAVVTELARSELPSPSCFSISFGDNLPNEIRFAQAVAKRAGVTHEIVTITPKTFSRNLRELIRHLDDPIGDPVTMPNFELARYVASLGFRHVWNGEGGDPCFGGPKNLYLLLSQWYESHQIVNASIEEVYLSSFRRAYEELDTLVHPELRRQIDHQRDLIAPLTPFFQATKSERFLDKLMAINMRMKGAHLILPKVERLLGAHGLTPLSPLFDESMAELSYSLPESWKIRNGIDKFAMREAYRTHLPASVIQRPKFGMRVPVKFWFRAELRSLAREILSTKRIEAAGIFNPERVRQILNFESEESTSRHGMHLWMLLIFELWREETGASL